MTSIDKIQKPRSHTLSYLNIFTLCCERNQNYFYFICFIWDFLDDGSVTERQTYPLTIEPYCVIVWKGLVWWSVKCYVVYLQTVSSNIICERRNEIKPVVTDHNQPSRLLTIFSEARRWSLKFVCRQREPAGGGMSIFITIPENGIWWLGVMAAISLSPESGQRRHSVILSVRWWIERRLHGPGLAL